MFEKIDFYLRVRHKRAKDSEEKERVFLFLKMAASPVSISPEISGVLRICISDSLVCV